MLGWGTILDSWLISQLGLLERRGLAESVCAIDFFFQATVNLEDTLDLCWVNSVILWMSFLCRQLDEHLKGSGCYFRRAESQFTMLQTWCAMLSANLTTFFFFCFLPLLFNSKVSLELLKHSLHHRINLHSSSNHYNPARSSGTSSERYFQTQYWRILRLLKPHRRHRRGNSGRPGKLESWFPLQIDGNYLYPYGNSFLT